MRKPFIPLPQSSPILPANPEEFVHRFPLFCEPKKHTRELRVYVDKLCLGLALPVLKDRRPQLWGYEVHPKYPNGIYMPIENDLKFLAQARYMHESKEYRIPDILDWLAKCPIQSSKISLDAFYYIVKTRPYFEEALKPFEERVKIIYELFRFTPPASSKEDGEREAAEKAAVS